jgi:putative ABC transport system permease protein
MIYEGVSQAFQQLRANKLRSFLSLLGITIGIFCIIAVKSAVDSLEHNIKDSFAQLGSDIIYVDKMPWNENPDENYWKYLKRPDPTLEEAEFIAKRSKMSDLTSFNIFVNGKTIKYGSSSVEGAFIMGPTYEYAEMAGMEFDDGRYFTTAEYATGANKVILGFEVAKELFDEIPPVGKYVKIYGQKFQIIGVIKKEGESLFSVIPFDEATVISYNTARKFINVRDKNRVGRLLGIRAAQGITVDELKDEITGIIRSYRRLKPTEDTNFALNEISMLNQVLDNVFGVINGAGFLIGIFALIVGMFSVANIMFVSVKERTNIIGIKKALGARKIIILFEFLIESIILCIIGGAIGLVFVYGVMELIAAVADFNMFLSIINVFWGVFASIAVGVLSGLIPAFLAARMDPVEAIRK